MSVYSRSLEISFVSCEKDLVVYSAMKNVPNGFDFLLFYVHVGKNVADLIESQEIMQFRDCPSLVVNEMEFLILYGFDSERYRVPHEVF